MKNVAKILCVFLIGLASATTANAAQLYRWVDAKGNVEWRDTPPPTAVPSKNIEQRRIGANVIGTGDVPFSVQLASKNHPVTFWGSSDCGKTCERARAHLARRGVPYADKNPKSDLEGFKKVSPAAEVPVLQVGTTTLKGYLEAEWDSSLDAAGYPRTAAGTRPIPATAAPTAPAAKAPADSPQQPQAAVPQTQPAPAVR